MESISNLSAAPWHFEVFKISLSCVLNIMTHNTAAVALNFNPCTQICGLTYWRAANNPSLVSTDCTVSIWVPSDIFRHYKQQMMSSIPKFWKTKQKTNCRWCFTVLLFSPLTQQPSLGYSYKLHTFTALKIWLPSASRCFDSVLGGILIVCLCSSQYFILLLS